MRSLATSEIQAEMKEQYFNLTALRPVEGHRNPERTPSPCFERAGRTATRNTTNHTASTIGLGH